MRFSELLIKKRDGARLTRDEISYIVNAYTKGEIPDYQMSAFLMAVYFKGMDKEETVNLTKAMAESGDTLDLSGIKGVKIDKHSTGGIGDKTTLIIGPILASLGIPVAKMSGRGLGFTGGTIDKLESIDGFDTSIPEERFIDNINRIGIALSGQTKNLAPADKKIYALRDVTGTVENLSLIASSIMSKKLAANADGICLDVTYGSGAFMKTKEDAKKLAEAMTDIGRMAGKRVVALITDMNEPLGHMVGNNLEVIEAVKVLKGEAEERLLDVCLSLAGAMIYLSGRLGDYERLTDEVLEKGKDMALGQIKNGEAYKKFIEFVNAQGGDTELITNPDKFKKAKLKLPVVAKEQGYLVSRDASLVGEAVLYLGGGRENIGDSIKPEVGVELLMKSGDKVAIGETYAFIYADDEISGDNAIKCVEAAYEISAKLPTIESSVYAFVE